MDVDNFHFECFKVIHTINKIEVSYERHMWFIDG